MNTDRQIVIICQQRQERSLAEIDKAKARYGITKHRFYLEEIKYWKKIHFLDKKRLKAALFASKYSAIAVNSTRGNR
jgi:hypothetical protein